MFMFLGFIVMVISFSLIVFGYQARPRKKLLSDNRLSNAKIFENLFIFSPIAISENGYIGYCKFIMKTPDVFHIKDVKNFEIKKNKINGKVDSALLVFKFDDFYRPVIEIPLCKSGYSMISGMEQMTGDLSLSLEYVKNKFANMEKPEIKADTNLFGANNQSDKINMIICGIILFCVSLVFIYINATKGELETPSKPKELSKTEVFEKNFYMSNGIKVGEIGIRYKMESALKEKLNDTESYQHIDTRYGVNADTTIITIETTYRTKNASGELIVNKARAVFDIKGNVILSPAVIP